LVKQFGSIGGSGTSVVNSGKNLSSNTSSNNNTNTVVNNNNNATIHQGANATANTGDNDASGNIAIGGGVAGAVLTGNAWTDISFMTVANGSATLVGGTGGSNGPGDGADIYITNTGGRFSGIGRLYQRTNTVVSNANNATINQSCGGGQNTDQKGGCSAITGGNNSSNNIAFGADAGVIHTGDAIVDVELNASVNNNKTQINGTGAGGAGAHADVVNSGDDFDLDNSADSETNTVVNNDNRARINQNVNAVADTGHNTANYNISFGGNAGVITTGNAIVNVVMNADANNNDTQISEPSAGMGGGSGASANTEVLNTGNNATINNSATTNNNTIVNNTNVLDLTQNVNAISNTGNNTANDNISTGCGCSGRFACISPCTAVGGIAGGIYTGDAFIETFMSVTANQNHTVIGDPAIGGPSDPADPAGAGGANTQSDAVVPPTVIPTTYIVNGGTGGTSIIAGTASEKTTQGTIKKIGRVLGAAKLPSTGSEDTLFILTLAAILFGAGVYMRKLNINNVSLRKEVKQ
jgi:LPXTG-motif cell wall-anchored protein